MRALAHMHTRTKHSRTHRYLFYSESNIGFAAEPRYFVYEDLEEPVRMLKLNTSTPSGEPEEYYRYNRTGVVGGPSGLWGS